MENMDNFGLNVRARSKETFVRAIAIACAASPGGTVTHFCEHPRYGLVLFWHDCEESTFCGRKVHPLSCEMGPREAAQFAWRWVVDAQRDRGILGLKGWDAYYRDGDVQNEPAYRIFVEDWGHVGGSPYAVVAILPVWAWLGK
jgi:hypothetical protein